MTDRAEHYRVACFPPEQPFRSRMLIWAMRVFGTTSVLMVAEQLLFRTPYFVRSSTGLTYLSIAIFLVMLLLDQYARHKYIVHRLRLEDRSEVMASIIEADSVESRAFRDEQDVEVLYPEHNEKKKDDLAKEVDRLKNLGAKGWTEYQVLNLNQMLVDFLRVDDLISRAQSTLGDLDDWAEGSAYTYDRKYYGQWEERINKAIDRITNAPDAHKREQESEQLRAVLRTLFEHIADYKAYWAKGSGVVRSLMVFGATAVPALIVGGLIPVIHPAGLGTIAVLDWGLLGAAGSLTSVLLYLYKTDRVEVGNTEGMNELWRAVLGSTLGFVAGTLVYCTIQGGLITSGAAVPDISSGEMTTRDAFLSVLLAVVSGMYFEGVFDRVRSRVVESN